jgi:hypothetical protein
MRKASSIITKIDQKMGDQSRIFQKDPCVEDDYDMPVTNGVLIDNPGASFERLALAKKHRSSPSVVIEG